MAPRQAKAQTERPNITKPARSEVSSLSILCDIYVEYKQNTPRKLKLIDAYLAYILITGIFQFVYCCLVGTFPFNAFLAGFISTVASFILAVCLRMHTNPGNKNVFPSFMPERAFGDFIFAHLVLHLAVFNFMG
uniref:Dolichyl-diphosphooligosaccharide--protein glycosyltransferase subunit DAD1 n=2 Tax=Schistocephalus solidus TaxID=70667 RepID=A0A0V0JCI6_SCHSO